MKIKALTIAAMLVVAAVALVGCSAPAPAPTAAPAVATEAPAVTEAPVAATEAPATAATEAPAVTAAAAPAQLELTVDELAAYNGKDGKSAYVAVKGVIYDVTNVAAWKDGMHKNGLTAGKDQTDMITKSPHGEAVLAKLPVVGKLK